jgi:hypothetical protein
MTNVYHRTALAQQMAQQLLEPKVLDLPLRSGLFLSGLRRTGKTTFLRQDLIPALEKGEWGLGEDGRPAMVIYVDLWSNVSIPPAELILRAVRAKLRELENPASAIWSGLKRIATAEVAAHGFKFKFDLSKLGEEGGATLAEAFTQVVDEAKTDLVVMVDEVQECLGREDAQALMQALKAARDAINLRPNTPGYFLFIGTGSHRSLVQEMTVRRKEAFAGAVSVDYPVLDEGFVTWVLEQMQAQGITVQPSPAAAWQAFRELGHRPEPFLDALRILAHAVKPGEDTDAMLRAVVWTKRASLADRELAVLEDLGPLAQCIFSRIASHEGEEARGIYSNEALEGYTAALGTEVRTDEVQATVLALQQKNLIRRMGHGSYSITDPFVKQVWLERDAPGAIASPGGANTPPPTA